MTVLARMTAWAKDDTLIKLLFDHLRNLGLCGVLAYAGIWSWQNAKSFYWYPVSVILCLLTGFLVALNQWHLQYRLTDRGVSKKLHIVFAVFYGLIAFVVLEALVER
jgi:hypothetical protein